jgi:hypothetical protein
VALVRAHSCNFRRVGFLAAFAGGHLVNRRRTGNPAISNNLAGLECSPPPVQRADLVTYQTCFQPSRLSGVSSAMHLVNSSDGPGARLLPARNPRRGLENELRQSRQENAGAQLRDLIGLAYRSPSPSRSATGICMPPRSGEPKELPEFFGADPDIPPDL